MDGVHGRHRDLVADAQQTLGQVVFRSAELREQGLTRGQVERAIRTGQLVRIRRGVFVVAGADPDYVRAARLGGRLACVSLLHKLGVFVLDHSRLHLHLPENAARLPTRGERDQAHWHDLTRPVLGSHAVSLRDAIQQAIRCQTPRAAVATMDSLLHRRVVDLAALHDICAELPRRFQVLLELVDGRSESGPETLLRLILRTIDCATEIQVEIRGVGRVDFVIDGWLIIECDSQEHHSDWDQQCRDRARDLEAAAQGYTTVRVTANDVFHRRDQLRNQLARVIAHGAQHADSRTIQATRRAQTARRA